MKTSILAGSIAVAGLSTLFAAPAAHAFCAVCPTALERPTPRSGFWADPDRAGSSMTLENQNGTWGGVYYGYDAGGAATWYTFSGVPERAAQGTAYWTLRANLLTFANGNCIDCATRTPEMTGSRGELELVVEQRNLIRYRVDGGATHTMQPLVWGTAMQHLLPAVPEARFPAIQQISWEDASLASAWLVTQRGESINDASPIHVRDVYWLDPWWPWEQSFGSTFGLFFHEDESPPPPGIRIQCGKAADWHAYSVPLPQELSAQLGDAPVCILEAQSQTTANESSWFVAQPGDIGDDYFFAVAADGKSVLEGTRLFYR